MQINLTTTEVEALRMALDMALSVAQGEDTIRFLRDLQEKIEKQLLNQ